MLKSLPMRCLMGLWVVVLGIAIAGSPVQAASVDPYVLQYLAKEPVAIKIDNQGQTHLFSPEELTEGKRLFTAHCKNCHVGGTTVPDPLVSLSLADLRGATPPRDNVSSLVAFQRKPMSYDGSEVSYWCRLVSESWLSTAELENLAAFVLRAAEKGPGWGAANF